MPGRRNALWAVRDPRREGLFEATRVIEPIPPLRQLPPIETLRFDYATKQLSIDDHPLKHLRAWLNRRHVLPIRELGSLRHHQQATVAGLVLCRQKPYTAKGLLFMTIEDETGVANLVVQQTVQDKYGLLLRQVGIVLAAGCVERSQTRHYDAVPVVHLQVQAIERLDHTTRTLRAMSRDFH